MLKERAKSQVIEAVKSLTTKLYFDYQDNWANEALKAMKKEKTFLRRFLAIAGTEGEARELLITTLKEISEDLVGETEDLTRSFPWYLTLDKDG